MMYETILSPIHYGGMQLKNRIIFAPTTFGLSDEEYLAKIRAIAQGGCAMIIVGDVPVGKSKFEKSLFDTKGFAFYQQVVKIAHDADCKVCAQLHQSDSNLPAMFKYIPGVLLKKITPDQLREKLNAEVAPYITKMSKRKIRIIISGFGKAAVLAKQAGFDMVQVHGDRMCGSFSSAIFNHHTDEYGGSKEYFDKILKKVEHSLDKSNTVFGCYMCQGKMPMSVRQRYEEMKKQPIHLPNLDAMIENFDKALSHPDADDLEQLKQAVR